MPQKVFAKTEDQKQSRGIKNNIILVLALALMAMLIAGKFLLAEKEVWELPPEPPEEMMLVQADVDEFDAFDFAAIHHAFPEFDFISADPLALAGDTLFVMVGAEIQSGPDDFEEFFYIGKVSANGTGLTLLQELISNEPNPEAGGEFFSENLIRAVARPAGGMLAVIGQLTGYFDPYLGFVDAELATMLWLFAADGNLEQIITLDDGLFTDFHMPSFWEGLQELPDGRIILAERNVLVDGDEIFHRDEVFILNSAGNLERHFILDPGPYIMLHSLIVLRDGRAIISLWDGREQAWLNHFFDLETGLIDSKSNVLPVMVHQATGLIPGMRHDLYAVQGDYVYGIDIDDTRIVRMFNWRQFATSFADFFLTEEGDFYIFQLTEDAAGHNSGGQFIRVTILE